MKGSFVAIDNTVWTVELLRDGVPIPSDRELDFPADGPLVIEWEHRDKEQPVCGSACTLTVISPGDRTYLDLYTIEAGSVRLDVYRNGTLYWSGTLDTEFYEEPYSEASDYNVTLTFSDFGLLDRIPYALAGTRTLEELVLHCLDKSGIVCTGIDTSMISTQLLPTGGATPLSALSVHSENWYDEDGEPSTLMEVLEGILQPLALKMVQRAGKIWVYDLNGLYLSASDGEIRWEGTDQMLGTDKVANNVKVTYSQYANADMGSKEVEYEGDTSKDLQNTDHGSLPVYPRYYTYYDAYNDIDTAYRSFTLFVGADATGLAYRHPDCPYFHVTPLEAGQECDGVAELYTIGHASLARPGQGNVTARKIGLPVKPSQSTVVLRTEPVHVPYLQSADARNYLLRVKVSMLFDPRYNPFEQEGEGNEQGNYTAWSDKQHDVRLQARITLRDASGVALYHYTNRWITVHGGDKETQPVADTIGLWEPGTGSMGDCQLQYRSAESASEGCGILGWQDNRQYGGHFVNASKSLAAMDPGQYIPYPPTGGYVEVEVFAGIDLHYPSTSADKQEWLDDARWLLLKAPVVELVKNNYVYSEASGDDIEYTGVVNANAKEDIEIDTVCGTAESPMPTAKGSYLWTGTGLQVRTLERAGRTTQAEQLLIGTMYSQYASRKAKLTGTVRLLPDGVRTYTDAAMPGVRFCVMADSQDAIAGEGEVELVELRPDEYDDND